MRYLFHICPCRFRMPGHCFVRLSPNMIVEVKFHMFLSSVMYGGRVAGWRQPEGRLPNLLGPWPLQVTTYLPGTTYLNYYYCYCCRYVTSTMRTERFFSPIFGTGPESGTNRKYAYSVPMREEMCCYVHSSGIWTFNLCF